MAAMSKTLRFVKLASDLLRNAADSKQVQVLDPLSPEDVLHFRIAAND